MIESILQERAEKVAELINGTDLMEAVNIIGEGIQISTRNGNDLHALIYIYGVACFVNRLNGRKGIIRIKGDGRVSFTVEAADRETIKLV